MSGAPLRRYARRTCRRIALLEGRAPAQVALRLPGLSSAAMNAEKQRSSLTRPGSERRLAGEKPTETPRPPQRGHGPAEQLRPRVIAETLDLDEADKTCPQCGDALSRAR